MIAKIGQTNTPPFRLLNVHMQPGAHVLQGAAQESLQLMIETGKLPKSCQIKK